MTRAVAAATSRVKVGTWIMSAFHRNPGITAKAVETLDEISGGRCVRDPATIGKSAGIVVEPTTITGAAEVLGAPLRGSAEEIADGLWTFRSGGFTHLELLLWPRTLAALEAMAPALEMLDAD
jgi:hypothetical protein